MKKILKIIAVLLLIAAAGIYYWQYNKKSIFKNAIQSAISDKTDSLYYLRYDSSSVDEINGKAYFEHVYLAVDSLQQQKLQKDNNLPNILVSVYVKSILATGVNIPLAINEKKLFAQHIQIIEPTITIIQTNSKKLEKQDTLAIYEKILGNFKSIKVENIEIIHANFVSKNKDKTNKIVVSDINIGLSATNIDSTKDYTNVLSYFIKNMKADAKRIILNRPNKSAIEFENLKYNALNKNVLIEKISTSSNGANTNNFEFNKLKLDDIDLDDFIKNQRINIGMVSTKGGVFTIYTTKMEVKQSNAATRAFEFPEDFFEEIEVGDISLGNTTLFIKNKLTPAQNPIEINNITFNLVKGIELNKRKTLRKLIDNAEWKIGATSILLKSIDNSYAITLKGIDLNKSLSTCTIAQCSVRSTMSELEFVKQSRVQNDSYSIDTHNLLLKGLNINQFINHSILYAEEADLQLNLNVFNDRNLPINPVSKVGKYPHQLILKSILPMNVKNVHIKNSSVSYREKSKLTNEVGNIYFTQVNGTVNNLTNIPASIQQNPICVLKGTGRLLNKTSCSTEWRLYMNAQDGKFEMDGEINSINFASFNPLTMPLALTTIDGTLNKFTFNMQGNDNEAHGNLIMLYNNLKIITSTKDSTSNTFKTNKFKNKLNNLFVKNNNPSNGNTREASFSYKRDENKSFFNLIWKSIYDGVQKTMLGKNVAELKKQISPTKKAK